MKFIYYLVFILLSVQVIFGFSPKEKQKDTVRFSKEELLQKKGVKLSNHWEFYWKEFINPTDFDNYEPLDIVQLTSWTKYLDEN